MKKSITIDHHFGPCQVSYCNKLGHIAIHIYLVWVSSQYIKHLCHILISISYCRPIPVSCLQSMMSFPCGFILSMGVFPFPWVISTFTSHCLPMLQNIIKHPIGINITHPLVLYSVYLLFPENNAHCFLRLHSAFTRCF